MPIVELLAHLRRDGSFMANVAAWRVLHAQPARTLPLPSGLHPALTAALEQSGVTALYTHQTAAFELTQAGEQIAVVTPTASGKTLCYALPTFQALLDDPAGRALYLFPTKALAHDQLAELTHLAEAAGLAPGSGSPAIDTYDGDTPPAHRSAVRRGARIVLTNPDMLHAGILPYHTGWAEFFAGLRMVVLDEMHTYRGVFGSQVANVLRRLRRICAHYGSRPQFICTSATIANPGELAERLVEGPVSVIADSGAPRGEKHVILYNPPLYDPDRGLRRNSRLEASELAARCVLGGLQTIVFGRSRLATELLLTYLRQRLQRSPATSGRALMVRGYRGGYLPDERRGIEAGLRSGEVRGVVATNALELGIDIGRLQAAVLCGYPGTIASAWQQIGRAGRTQEASLAILVATAGVLDQYIVQHPEYLFSTSPEHALIHPDNLMLLVDQVRCAAFELPFRHDERLGSCPHTSDVLRLLAEGGDLYPAGSRYLWSGAGYPARAVSLRSAGSDAVSIQAQTDEGPRIVGQVDRATAALLVHPGAVYLHEGESYLSETLDLECSLARVRPMETDFYTQVTAESEIAVTATVDERDDGRSRCAFGSLLVTSQIIGYRRIKRFTHETLGVFQLSFPPQTLETDGYWLSIPVETQTRLAVNGRWFDGVNDYGPDWETIRRQVRSRDGCRCRRCSAPEPPGRQHDVHHLVPFRTFGYVRGVNDQDKVANRLNNLLLVCRACHMRLETAVPVRGALDGLAYLLANLAPLHLMCDPGDLGVSVAREGLRLESGAAVPAAVEARLPTVVLYEQTAAGLGFSLRLFELHDVLIEAAASLIRRCPCSTGCPSCVGPVLENEHARLETKALTLALADALRGADGA